MIFHENCLLADDSHVISYLIFVENWERCRKICRLLQLGLALYRLSGHSKRRAKIGFQDRLSLNAGQGEYSAILMTFIKLPFVIKAFVLSIFE